MFREKYNGLMDSFTPGAELTRRTVLTAEKARRDTEARKEASRRRSKKLRKRLIPAAAAVMAVVIAAAVILSPGESTGGFTIIASAESTADRALNSAEFRPIADIAAHSGFVGLNLIKFWEPDGNGALADDPVMIAEGLFNMRIEGENIKYVTFSLSKGKFRVSDGSKWKLHDYEGKTDSYLDIEQENEAYYDSITFSYDNQLSLQPSYSSLFGDAVFMFIPHEFDPARDRELLDRFLNLSALRANYHGEGLEPEDEFCKVYEDLMNALYEDVKIIVTVTYTDKSTETVSLALKATCAIHGKLQKTYRIGPGDSEDDFATCDIYDYYVTLNARIEE